MSAFVNERGMVTLVRERALDGGALAYINRLSDLLFILARQINLSAGADETLWQHGQ